MLSQLQAPPEATLDEGEVEIGDTIGSAEDVADSEHATDPKLLSSADVEKHRVDHNPYRS